VTTDVKNIPNTDTLAGHKKPEYLKSVALRTYSNTQKNSQSDVRITELLPMVSHIARKVTTYLKPPLSFEDMVSAGMVGLVKAARDYDEKYNTEFKTYAYIRIKGAILDELRSWSFVPENAGKQIKTAIKASKQITSQTGLPPTDDMLAKKLGISTKKLYQIFDNARVRNFVSIDNTSDSQGSEVSLKNILTTSKPNSPSQQLEKTELLNGLTAAIQQLTDRQRKVIILYYQQQLTMKQVAEVLEITESRVSQLHSSALFYLSSKLEK
jgi:RNA polymerase sigma factor for flagellar operon FliA